MRECQVAAQTRQSERRGGEGDMARFAEILACFVLLEPRAKASV